MKNNIFCRNEHVTLRCVRLQSLILSSSARRTTTVGEMTNLIATNAYTFEFNRLIGIFIVPLRIIIGTIILYQYLGLNDSQLLFCLST